MMKTIALGKRIMETRGLRGGGFGRPAAKAVVPPTSAVTAWSASMVDAMSALALVVFAPLCG